MTDNQQDNILLRSGSPANVISFIQVSPLHDVELTDLLSFETRALSLPELAIETVFAMPYVQRPGSLVTPEVHYRRLLDKFSSTYVLVDNCSSDLFKEPRMLGPGSARPKPRVSKPGFCLETFLKPRVVLSFVDDCRSKEEFLAGNARIKARRLRAIKVAKMEQARDKAFKEARLDAIRVREEFVPEGHTFKDEPARLRKPLSASSRIRAKQLLRVDYVSLRSLFVSSVEQGDYSVFIRRVRVEHRELFVRLSHDKVSLDFVLRSFYVPEGTPSVNVDDRQLALGLILGRYSPEREQFALAYWYPSYAKHVVGTVILPEDYWTFVTLFGDKPSFSLVLSAVFTTAELLELNEVERNWDFVGPLWLLDMLDNQLVHLRFLLNACYWSGDFGPFIGSLEIRYQTYVAFILRDEVLNEFLFDRFRVPDGAAGELSFDGSCEAFVVLMNNKLSKHRLLLLSCYWDADFEPFYLAVGPFYSTRFRRLLENTHDMYAVFSELLLLEGAGVSKSSLDKGVHPREYEARSERLERIVDSVIAAMPTISSTDDFTPEEIVEVFLQRTKGVPEKESFYSMVRVLIRDVLITILPPALADFFDNLTIQDFIILGALVKCRDPGVSALLCAAVFSSRAMITFWSEIVEKDGPRMMKKFVSLFSDHSSSEEYVPEGFFSDSSDLMSALRHSPLSTKFAAMAGSMWGLASFTENSMYKSNFIDENLLFLSSLGAKPMGLVESFLSLAKHWEEALANYKVSGNIWDLFGRSKALEILEEIKDFMSRTTHASLTADNVDLRALFSEGQVIIGKAILVKDQLVSREVGLLMERLASLSNGTKMMRGKAPIGFILYGPPGTGKTQFCSTLHDCWRQLKHKDQSISVMHTWTETAFQTLPTLVDIVILNDALSVKDELASESELVLLQRFVDLAPLCANQASIPDKANCLLDPVFIGATTNATSYTFSKSVSGADKLDRRYVAICCRFSDKCKALASKNNCSCADVVKENGPDGFVEYCLGRMDNSPKEGVGLNELRLAIKKVLVPWTTSRGSIVQFLIKSALERKAVVATPEILCGKCFSLARECDHPNVVCKTHNISTWLCDCPKVFCGTSGCELPGCPGECGKRIIKKPVLDAVLGDCLMMEGAGASRPGTDRPFFAFSHDVLIPEDTRSYIASVLFGIQEYVDYKEKKWTESVVTGCGAIVAFVGFLTFASKMYGVLCPEGNVTSVVNIPKERNPIPPFASTSNSWLGGGAGNYQLSVKHHGLAMRALLISASCMVLPKHFFGDPFFPFVLKEGDLITVSREGVDYSFAFQKDYVVMDPLRDVAYCYLPSFPAGLDFVYQKLPECRSVPAGDALFKGQKVQVSRDFRYVCETSPGDCGIPIVDSAGVVFGFHIGSYSRERQGVAICRQDFRKICEVFRARRIVILPTDSVVEGALLEGLLPGLHPQSNAHWSNREGDLRNSDHYTLGHYASCDKPHFTVRKSELFPFFGDRCAPYGEPWGGKARLVDGVYTSAETIRFKGMLVKPVLIDHPLMSKCVDMCLDEIPTPKDKFGPLSLYQAICGDPLNVLVNARDNSKSVGHSLKLKGVTKLNAFKLLPSGEYVAHPKVLEEIEKVLSEMRSGVVNPSLVKACAKDEVYPVEKSLQGKKRYFYNGDLPVNVVSRMYLLPILFWLLKHPHESGCVVTINAASPQWGELLRMFTRHSDLVYDSDQKGLDVHQAAVLNYYISFMLGVGKKIGYSDLDCACAAWCLVKNGRYLLIMEGNLFVCNRGLNSGRIDTIVVNCITMKLTFYYSIGKKVSKRVLDLSTREWVVECPVLGNVCSVGVTGDDSGVNVSPALGITGEVFQVGFAECGYEITSADKKGDITERHYSEIQYLKRGFVCRDNRVWAPLSLESIYKSLSYHSGISSQNERERNIGACRSAAREAFLHGRLFHSQLCREMTEVLLGLGEFVTFPSYDELLWDFDNGLLTVAGEPVGLSCLESAPLGSLNLEGDQSLIDLPLPLKRGSGRGVMVEEPFGFPSFTQLWRIGESSQFNNFSTEINDSMPAMEQETSAPVNKLGSMARDVTTEAPGQHDLRRPMPDVALSKLLARPVKILTFTGTTLTGNLFATWKANVAVAAILNQWALFRGEPKIYIQYSGSPTLIGVVRLSVYPEPALDEYSQGISVVPFGDSVTQTFERPHLDLDLSLSCSCDLALPYPKPFTFMERVSGKDYHLRIETIVTLQRADGLTPLMPNIDVYVGYENVEFDVLVPQGELPSGPMSLALEYAAALAGRSKNKFATSISKALSLGSSIASLLGWSRPPEEAQMVVIARKHGNLALGSGQPDFSSQLGLDPNVSRNVELPFMPFKQEGDTDIYALSRRWCQLSSGFNISGTLPCHPGAVAGAAANILYPTRLAYVAWVFKKWTGTLTYKVVVQGSPLVRARLGINVIPPGAAVPGAFVSNGTMLSHIMEVAGTTELVFDVPYLHYLPWRDVSKSLFTVAAIAETRLVFFWISPSSGPAATPIVLPITIFVCAGQDYQLAIPSLDLLEGVSYDGGGIGLLSETLDLEGQSVETFGEIVEDIRVLMRRPCHNASLVWIATTGHPNRVTFPCDGLQRMPDGTQFNASPDLVTVYNSRLTFFQYLRAPYVGYSGGSVLKVVYNGVNMLTGEAARAFIGGWRYNQEFGSDFDPYVTTGAGSDIFQYPEQSVFEISNPDRCSTHWKYPSWHSTLPTSSFFTTCYTFAALTTASAEAEVITEMFISARDDVNVGGWLSAPTVYF